MHSSVITWLQSVSQKELNWTQQDLLDVHWMVLQMTLDSFLPNDQWQIILFINNKLPLRASKAYPHMGSTLCPSFQWEPKDAWHFLQCTQWNGTALFNALKVNLSQMAQSFNYTHAFSHLYSWVQQWHTMRPNTQTSLTKSCIHFNKWSTSKCS